jgi:hypothetical protein
MIDAVLYKGFPTSADRVDGLLREVPLGAKEAHDRQHVYNNTSPRVVAYIGQAGAFAKGRPRIVGGGRT